jgi:ribonuclease T2
MPPEIVLSEWRKHGTCTGLSGDEYLALIRRLYDSIRIPPKLAAPRQSFALQPALLKEEFHRANPSLAPQDIVVQLRQRYLNAVEICFSKTGSPIPCSNLKDAPNGRFLVPPVR